MVSDYVQGIGVDMAAGFEQTPLGFHYCIALVDNCHIAVVDVRSDIAVHVDRYFDVAAAERCFDLEVQCIRYIL